ncbi:MAG: hypothetical protein ABIM99_05735 [Candidatus Dojkabacteria bacterium]
MSDIQLNTLEDNYKRFIEKGFYNISEEFPFSTSQELFEVLYINMFMGVQQITRLPIIATEKGVFIQTQPSSKGEMQHSSLIEKLGISPSDIKYASGIEQMRFTQPTNGLYIKVPFKFNNEDKTGFWVIKTSSDQYDKPITFDEAYIAELKEIFERIQGVEFFS